MDESVAGGMVLCRELAALFVLEGPEGRAFRGSWRLISVADGGLGQQPRVVLSEFSFAALGFQTLAHSIRAIPYHFWP